VRGWRPAPQRGVVHRRKVVVDEGVRVDELEPAGRREELVGASAERFGRRETENRSKALASGEEAVAHRAMESLGPAGTGGHLPLELGVDFGPARREIRDDVLYSRGR